MNKDLTPLEAFKRFKNNIRWLEENTSLKGYFENSELHFEEDLDIIEKELKEKEQQDSVIKTLKEIIEFNNKLPYIEPNKDDGFNIISAVRINLQRDVENKERELLRKWVLETCFSKELKALEIIKNKKVNIDDLYTIWSLNNIDDENCLKIYNNPRTIYGKPKLTQEEYDILKEVILWKS